MTYQDVSALQKNEELSNALHYSQKRDEELTKALKALGMVFTNIFLVHLEDQKVEWLKIQADKENVLKQCQNVCEIRKLIHDNYMLPECQNDYLEFTDLDTISERFEKHKILRYIYRNMDRQWIEVSAIVMNAIIGFTALAVAHMDQPDLVKDYLTKIGTSSQHLLSLINDVLDMSRIESGVVKIEEKEVCIPDILHDLKTIIQGNIQAKQQDLYIDTQDVVHENVITDRLRLNQILLNIVSNAIKFTPVGGLVNIRVSEKPCNRKGFAAFEFRIRDNGIGMSEEFQAHVFDSFSRERTSTQSGIKGTGLGMAIIRNIVAMTANAFEEDKEKSFKAGMNAHITKPIDIKIILAVLDQVLGTS